MDEVAVKVEGVTKTFRLPHEKRTSVKSIFLNLFKRQTFEKQKVLKNMSFEVRKGEFFGIVGRNGSGKSTLLKLLAGIYSPDKGAIHINGKLIPFIELGVGFNPELTGRENVFLNGALLGFSRKEMLAMYDEIVEFAELERFMDQKLKNYSSGMQVRLAFSIAIRARGDILVLDEVLAVGDEAFQRKCYQYFAELRRQHQTVILVTHSMDAVQQFCNRAMLVDKGHKTEIGSPLKIAQLYRQLNDQNGVTINKANKQPDTGTKYVSAKVGFTNHGDELEFDINVKPRQNLKEPIIGLEIFRDDGEQVIRWVSDEEIKSPLKLIKNKNVNLNLKLQNIFPNGIFSARLLIRRRDRSTDYGIFNEASKFEIRNTTQKEFDTFWKPNEKYTLRVSDD